MSGITSAPFMGPELPLPLGVLDLTAGEPPCGPAGGRDMGQLLCIALMAAVASALHRPPPLKPSYQSTVDRVTAET